MTPARTKTGLSETAKSMLVLWYKEQLYGRKNEISSKYMTKGNECEDASIAYLNKLDGTDYKKNEQYFEDEYMHGTPDVIGEDIIIDIKNSWDFSTFPLFSNSLPNKDYRLQVTGYMMLTGKKKGSVVYTLMDTPDDIIAQEWRSAGNYNQPVSDEFKAKYKYDDITDSKLRIKRFDFDYDETLATEIVDKVEEARKFISCLRY
jgi:hypothetical protein